MAQFEQWNGFKGKDWKNSVDVRSFIQDNYTVYEGDEAFLAEPTESVSYTHLTLPTILLV